MCLSTQEFKFKKAKDYFTILSLSIFFSGFGYGTVVTLNCMYDESVPECTWQPETVELSPRLNEIIYEWMTQKLLFARRKILSLLTLIWHINNH